MCSEGEGFARCLVVGLGVKEIKEAGFTYVDMMMGGFCPDEVLLQVRCAIFSCLPPPHSKFPATSRATTDKAASA